MLSATGRALRIDRDPDADETPRSAPRATKHGAVVARVATSVRGELGAILSDGTLHRFTPVDLPLVPAASIAFSAGVKLTEYIGLSDKKLRIVGVVPLDSDTPVGVFTAQGVVKRVVLTDLPARPDFEIISLKPGDTVVSAFPAPDDAEFAAVTSDAQLLRFAASLVRPQGRPAGGMAGMKLGADATVIFAGAVAEGADARVATVAEGADENALLSASVSSAKLSDWADFPAKGRATGGVRAQRFLKGEDRLVAAWVGSGEPRAIAADGAARKLPAELGKRDGSGEALDTTIAYIGEAP